MKTFKLIVIFLLVIGVERISFSGDISQQQNIPPAVTTDKLTPKAESTLRERYSGLIKDMQVMDGLFKLYRREGSLYAELESRNLNTDFIITASISRGMGKKPLLGGMYRTFGDDWIWQFRRAEDRVNVVSRNVRFKADKESPEARAVQIAFTDSILFSLPILGISPSGAVVIDLAGIFKTDMAAINADLPNYSFSRDKTSWGMVKVFKNNLELELQATWSGSDIQRYNTVADSRGVTLVLHYSLSRVPSTGYTPRLADDRVGYFLTVHKDYSRLDNDRFVRYINRWDLRKADPNLEVSPPKQPVVFWIEKTVPYKYRKAIRDGILLWNTAFEQAGFSNALEVRQQSDDADWQPEDINYNTFRWMTASQEFAQGPSRVNPITGQILDADVIMDADFIINWKETVQRDQCGLSRNTFTPTEYLARNASRIPTTLFMTGNDVESYSCPSFSGVGDSSRGYSVGSDVERSDNIISSSRMRNVMYDQDTFQSVLGDEISFGVLAMACMHQNIQMSNADKDAVSGKKKSEQELEQIIYEGVRFITVHELGHTLGLRHNFKGSLFHNCADLNNRDITVKQGLISSVMDYVPVNLALPGEKQGEYFPSCVGPYDIWAIQYGYKPLSGGTYGEEAVLRKMASRCAEPALDYATDEDSRDVDPDPLTVRFDLGRDPLEYAQRRIKLIREIFKSMLNNTVKEGENYENMRRTFFTVLNIHQNTLLNAKRFLGGSIIHRDHRGDPNARKPVEPVSPSQQRRAVKLIIEEMFSESSYNFPPELYTYLADANWSHWGYIKSDRAEYALLDGFQARHAMMLNAIFNYVTLSRILDQEFKLPSEQDTFTLDELFTEFSSRVFSELNKLDKGDYTVRNPGISVVRRNIQQTYISTLVKMTLGNTHVPRDARALSRRELGLIQLRISDVLNRNVKLDPYSQAHLEELQQIIKVALDPAAVTKKL